MRDMVHTILAFALAAAALALPPALDAQSPVISSVSVSNVTVSSAQISWFTDVPASTQVILMGSQYEPQRRVPEPQDTGLTTFHRVVLADLVPSTTYWFYVASANAAQNLATTYDSNSPASFATLAVDPTAAFAYRLDVSGGRSVYVGHDLYVDVAVLALGGALDFVYFNGASGLPADASARLMCSYRLADPLDESSDSFFTVPEGQPFCWVNPGDVTRLVSVRFRVPTSTLPGASSAVLTFTVNGVAQQVNYTFNILPPPQPVVARTVGAVPPIPNLKNWEDNMIYLGKKWCNPAEVMQWGYEPDIWYYDGGRTYLQIADYTKDPNTWYPCAFNIINQYRDEVIARQGYYEGWRVFPHGLAMSYWRNGDVQARQAVVLLSQAAAYASSGGSSNPALIRETAYVLEAYVKAEELGQPRNPHLARTVDFALGMFDQLFVSNTASFNQPFYDGLMAEALIQYYELTKDPRVPPTIKTMLDWLWDNAYDPKSHAFAYNPLQVPQVYVNQQSNVIIAAYAWYWQLTGDPLYLQRGDDLFAHALDTDISYSGKIFNQNYRWSFDYVRWRSNDPTSTTQPETNTPDYVARVQDPGPIVDAGADLAIAWPANRVALNGSATDVAASIVNVVWSQASGPASVVFSAPNSLSTLATFSAPGVYLFTLTASDRFKSASDTVQVTVGPTWYDPAWHYRKRITIDHTKVVQNLSGFPVLISISDPDLKLSSYGGKVESATGKDLNFTNGGNVPIPFEIEQYDSRAGQLIAWVKSDVSASVDVRLGLYFGNARADGRQDGKAVWDSNYKGVWHLNPTSVAGYNDSTGNGNNGVATGAPAFIQGMIGGAMKLDGSSYITIYGAGPIRLGNNFTWETWVNSDTFLWWEGLRSLISQGSLPPEAYPATLVVHSDFRVRMFIKAWGEIAWTTNPVLSAGQWYHVVYIRDGLGETSKFYVNGSPVAVTLSGVNFSDATGPTYIGTDPTHYNFKGGIDEVRMSDIARSPAWIATEYENQRAPSSFCRVYATEKAY